MSRIDELIAELCPNGVEYKKLVEVATISRGGSFQKKDFCEDGVPCIHYGQIYTRYGLFADKTLTFISADAAKKQKYAVKNDIVMAVTSENIDDVCKCVAWLGDDEIAENDYNLSVSTYVEQEDTREVIDIDVLNAEIAEIVKREDVLRAEIDRIIAEIEV